jgi:hypothetical protein
VGGEAEFRFAAVSGAGSSKAVAEEFPCQGEFGALQVHGVFGGIGAVVGYAVEDAFD